MNLKALPDHLPICAMSKILQYWPKNHAEVYETTPDTKTINNQHYKCQTNAPSPTASSLQMQIWIMPIVGMQHMQKCRCACNVDSS